MTTHADTAQVWPNPLVSKFDKDTGSAVFVTEVADGFKVRVTLVVEAGEIRFKEATFWPDGGPDKFPASRLFANLRMVTLEQRIADFLRFPPFMAEAPPAWKTALLSPTRFGRRKKPDSFYAMWAKEYVDALDVDPKHPVDVMLEAYPERQTKASILGYVNKARSRKLLTEAPPGKAGGELTPRAIQVLKGQ